MIQEIEKLEDICHTILDELNFISRNEMSHRDIKLAKNSLKTEILGNFSSPKKLAHWHGWQIMHWNRALHPSELIRRIDDVSAGDIRSVAEQYLFNSHFVMSVLGDLPKKFPVYDDFRRRMLVPPPEPFSESK